MQARKHLNDAVSAIVRAYRAKLGISQEKLSVKAGLDRTFVSKIEKASRNPTIESIFRLSEAFGVLPEDLLKEIREEQERRKKEDPNVEEGEGGV
jgi:transcriptional regulator with XRE-family HTH domain